MRRACASHVGQAVNEGRRYRVICPIGKGGFGTVYRAELMGEQGFSKVVALKILNPNMENAEEVAQRFRDEARMLGLVRHRAIIQVDSLVRLRGRWTVVMECVEGADLRQVLREGALPIAAAAQMAGEVAAALDAAYNCVGPDGYPLRLLHRDIKPGNVRITPMGEVKLLDFGIARADFVRREAFTHALQFGSDEYMSPERHDLIDGPEGDVYALGAVLFEAVTGEAFGRTFSREERHRERHAERMVFLAEQLEDGAGPFRDLISQMLEYEAEDRPKIGEVERRCWELQRDLPGERLRDWARGVVGSILVQRVDISGDDLSGATLIETIAAPRVQNALGEDLPEPSETIRESWSPVGAGETAEAAQDPAPPAEESSEFEEEELTDEDLQWRPRRALPLLFAVGLGLPLVLGTLIWALWPDAEPEAPPEPVPRVENQGPSAAMDPVEAGTVKAGAAFTLSGTVSDPDHPSGELRVSWLQGEQELCGESAVADDGAVACEAVFEAGEQEIELHVRDPEGAEALASLTLQVLPRKKGRKRKEPVGEGGGVKAPPAGARVSVVGDAKRVLFVSGAGRFGPGRVPAGAYTVKADFGEGELMVAGQVQVVAGKDLVLSCDEMFTRCQAQ